MNIPVDPLGSPGLGEGISYELDWFLPSLFPPPTAAPIYGLPYGFTVKSQMIPERSDDCFGLNSRCVAVDNRCTTLYNCIAP